MTSYQVAEWLRQGIAAAQAGDAERASELLMRVVDVDEYNEQAWLWLSSIVGSDADREICLENVLAINPDNKLAKSGLVHIRTKKAQPPAPREPEPAPPPPLPDPGEALTSDQALDALASDWWDQPLESAAGDVVLEGPVSHPTAPGVEEAEMMSAVDTPDPSAVTETLIEAEAPTSEPKLWKRSRPVQPSSVGWRSIGVLFLLGLLAAAAAAVVVVQSGVLDSDKSEYAAAMRPLLADYDAWWAGPQGALVSELNSLCGSGAEGWRNSDVLYACSAHGALDCELLAAHCEADIETMRSEINQLSREAQRMGASLVETLDEVAPPDEIAAAHTGFRRCVQSQVSEADRIAKMARGEDSADSSMVPECQIFSAAETEVREYIASQ
jgi:hypothetical protein